MAAKIPTPTNNVVPSGDIRDHVFAGSRLDQAMTGKDLTYTDRLGGVHDTWPGIQKKNNDRLAEIDKIITSLDTASFTFPDISSGLAGTSNGQYFRVPQGSQAGLAFIYYRNANGSAAMVADTPSGHSVDVLNSLVNDINQNLTSLIDGVNENGLLGFEGDENIIPVIIDDELGLMISFNKVTKTFSVMGLPSGMDFSKAGVMVHSPQSSKERYVPVVIADENNAIITLDKEKKEVLVLGTPSKSNFDNSGVLSFNGNENITPIIIDDDMHVIFGFDNDTKKLTGAFDSSGDGSFTGEDDLPAGLSPELTSQLQIIVYGQSLTLGASTTEVISDSQPYSNITYNFGPRTPGSTSETKIFFPVKPLVESHVYTQGNDCAETICSGAANFACNLFAREGGNPNERIFLATSAGRGNTKISDLKKGTGWYNSMFLPHISKSVESNSNTSLLAVPWLQGEADCTEGTSYQSYYNDLTQLQIDIESDGKLYTRQTSPVFLITYQLSYKTLLTSNIAAAQLTAVRENNRIWLSTPTYHIQYNTDLVHLTATGYKHLGAYVGKALNYLLKGKKPKFLNPVSAISRGNEIVISFDVPVKPLVIDTDFVASLTDYGIAVVDTSGVKQTLSNISVSKSGDSILVNCAVAPKHGWKIRLGYDYQVNNGRDMAGTNIRDSDNEYIIIKSKKFYLWNVCPHDIMNIKVLGE